MFVVNRGDHFAGPGSITRFLNPVGVPVPNGTIETGISGPHHAVFKGGELFVAQRVASNVVRFRFNDAGDALFNGTITAGLCCTAPRGAAFSPTGELFVTECCGVSEINRYVFNNANHAVPNGTITGNGLENPHEMKFSASGELFVANAGLTPESLGDSVSRFTFDALGNAVPNGVITGPMLSGPVSLAFSPWGELFVGNADAPGGVTRWTFDGSGTAISNGAFSTPSNVVIDVEFGP